MRRHRRQWNGMRMGIKKGNVPRQSRLENKPKLSAHNVPDTDFNLLRHEPFNLSTARGGQLINLWLFSAFDWSVSMLWWTSLLTQGKWANSLAKTLDSSSFLHRFICMRWFITYEQVPWGKNEDWERGNPNAQNVLAFWKGFKSALQYLLRRFSNNRNTINIFVKYSQGLFLFGQVETELFLMLFIVLWHLFSLSYLLLYFWELISWAYYALQLNSFWQCEARRETFISFLCGFNEVCDLSD